MIAGVCLLAFTFTITVCGHTLNKRQDIDSCTNLPPDLIDCINDLASGDITVFCSSNCRSDVEDYYERCLGEAALNTLSSICDAFDMPSIDNSCLNITTDVQECINAYTGYGSGHGSGHGSGRGSGYGSGDSLACSSECMSELDDYYQRCTDEATLESFREDYNALCGIDSCTVIPTDVENCNSIPEACTPTCRSILEDYVVLCLPGSLEDLRETLESVCDTPGIDDSCQNITTDLQECIDGFSNRDAIVTCSSNCRSELESHYEMCFETGFEAFRQSYSLLCDSPIIDNCLNITTGLEQCLNNFTISDISACSSTCRPQLEGYFEMCVTDNLEAFRETYSALCDMPITDDSCVNISPALIDCFNDLASGDFTVFCSSNCRSDVEDYYERCLGGAALNTLRTSLSSICGTPDMPGIDDSCQNITTDLQECIDGFNNRDTIVTCSSNCTAELEYHYEMCFEGDVEAFRQSYSLLCDSPTIDNCLNITTGLEQCLNNFTNGDISACSSTCGSQLEGYFELCIPDSFEAFRQAYNSLCDMPSPDNSCQISANLQDCFDSVASDPTVMCSPRCWPELAGYYESCLGEVALDRLRQVYSSICNIPDMPGIGDSCLNITTDLQECIDGFNNRDTIITCSSNCTAELEYHYEMCFEGDVGAFRQSYSLLCDSPTIDNCLNITTGLEQCLNNFTNGDISACSSTCGSQLEGYFELCIPDSFEAFRQAYNSLCDMPSPDNSCQISANLQDCFDSVASDPTVMCSPRCWPELAGYYESCLGEVALDRLRQVYSSICNIPDMPGIGDSCLNITTDLQECIDGFNNRDTIVTCSSNCTAELEYHYEMCFEGDVGAFRQSYSLLCDSPTIDNCLNITTGLEQCLNNFTNGDISACSSTCGSQLEGYFELCIPDSFEAFRQAYNSLCDMPSPDNSCQISANLQDCFDSVASDPTVMCSPRCWPELAGYYESCLGEVALDRLRQVYSSICNIPDMPGIDDSCLLSNMNRNFTDCINSLGGITSAATGGDSPACTSECRSDIEDYIERCLDTAIARAFVNVLNAVCDKPSSESGNYILVHVQLY